MMIDRRPANSHAEAQESLRNFEMHSATNLAEQFRTHFEKPEVKLSRLDRWFPHRRILLLQNNNTITLHFPQRLQIVIGTLLLIGMLTATCFMISTIVSQWTSTKLAVEVSILKAVSAKRGLDVQIARDEAAHLRQQLEQNQAHLEATQAQTEQLQKKTDEALETADRLIRNTGLSPEQLAGIHRTDPGAARARGGPLLPWPATSADPSPSTPGANQSASASDNQARLARLQLLTAIMSRMPLSSPLQKLEITSPFGKRIDPFTGAVSFHPGVDLEGALGTPIYATAPGKVVTAGWGGEYGMMVEVSNGYGISTVYGHLSKVLVRVGDTVDLHQSVGLMGATGRATGVHLHYEIRYHGAARDPLPFLGEITHASQEDPDSTGSNGAAIGAD